MIAIQVIGRPLITLVAFLILTAAHNRPCAGEYRERVQVAAPTRLDWSFAVAKQSRVDPPLEWIGRGYHSTQQTYELFVPDESALREQRPLVLFISSTDKARGWQSWSAVCRRYNIIFAGPHDAGKSQSIARRIRVVLDVLDDVRKRHPVDPDRTYLCGISDGAHMACRIGFALPEYFGGIVAVGGSEIPPKELWLRRQIAERLSVVFLRSRRDSQRRSLFTSVFRRLAALQGTRVESRSYSGSPRSMPDSRKLAASLQWVDADVARRRGLAARFPSTRVGNEDVVSREERARQVITDARKRLGDAETRYLGLLQLEGVCQRWPELAAAKEAQTILDDYKSRQPQPWRGQHLADRQEAFRAYEWSYNEIYSAIHGHRRWRLAQGYSPYPEEHAEMSWIEPTQQPKAHGEEDAAYDGATQSLLQRLGRRVGFDERRRVNMLDLSGSLVSGRQVRTLKESLHGMPDLRALDLSRAMMRGSVLYQVSELNSLRAVNLSFTDLSNRDLSSLANLVDLQYLAVVYTDVSSLNQLGSPRSLRTLILGGTRVDDAALTWLTGAANLRRLSLFSTGVTDRGIARLKTLPTLEYVNLSSTRITNEACTHLSQLRALTHLILDNADITDHGLSALKGLDRLRQLSLAGSQITDYGLQHINQLTTLQTVDLRKTRVTASGVAGLRDSLPGVEVVWNKADAEAKRKERDRLRTELFLNRFEDQYRLKLLEYQRRYYGFCVEAELPLQ